jgi:hypothetical protein
MRLEGRSTICHQFLTGDNDVGVWNWDENHDLRNIKMFPLAWRKLLGSVDKTMGEGSPARDYILTSLYDNQKELREAYRNAPPGHLPVPGEHFQRC